MRFSMTEERCTNFGGQVTFTLCEAGRSRLKTSIIYQENERFLNEKIKNDPCGYGHKGKGKPQYLHEHLAC